VMVLFTSAVHCAVSAERNGITSPNAEVSSIDAVMSTVPVGPRPAEDASGRAGHNPLTAGTAIMIVQRMVNDTSQSLNRLFSALGDPTRRSIVARLARDSALS